MDQPLDMLQIKIERAKENLSQETKHAIASVDWRAYILSLREKKGYSFEQLEDLELETELLLCGLLDPAKYSKELEERMKIPRAQVDLLVSEMNEFVFKKIKDELIKNLGREEVFVKKQTPEYVKPENKITETEIKNEIPFQFSPLQDVSIQSKELEAPEKETISKNENNVLNQAGIEITRPIANDELRITNSELEKKEVIPEKKSTDSILSQKLSGSFQIPTIKTEYTLPSFGKEKADKENSEKTKLSKVDPYRLDPNE